MEVFARGARKQLDDFRMLTQQWVGAYRDFFSPFAHAQEGLKTAQQATQQVTQQGLRLAEETADHTEKIIRQTE